MILANVAFILVGNLKIGANGSIIEYKEGINYDKINYDKIN